MAAVKKGTTNSANNGAKRAAPKLANLLAEDELVADNAISFISKKGADGAFIIAPGPKHNAQTGALIGWDNGIYLDFQGVGVTKPYFPDKSKADRELVARIEEAVQDGLEIIEDIGLEVLKPEAPRPPFAKWDRTSPSAIKVALSVLFDEDDHDANVALVKAAARYETANQNREDVLGVLQGLLAVEATESDAYDVEVHVS